MRSIYYRGGGPFAPPAYVIGRVTHSPSPDCGELVQQQNTCIIRTYWQRVLHQCLCEGLPRLQPV